MADRHVPRAAFISLFVITMVTGIGNTGLISLMPAIGRELGISDYLVASIFSLSACMWAVFAPFWGKRSDMRGRKPFILLGLCGFIASMAGCGLVVLAESRGLLGGVMLFVAFLVVRSSYGVLGSASASASQAYVADRTEGRERMRAIASLAGALSLGTILGPALAPFLVVPSIGQSSPMFLFAIGGMLLLVFTPLALPADARPQPSETRAALPLRTLVSDARMRPFLIYGFAISSAQAANTYTLGFMLIDRLGKPPAQAQPAIGVAMAVGAMASLAAQWGLIGLAGMMPRNAMRIGTLLVLLGNLSFVLLPGHLAAVIGFAITSMGYGLARPGFSAGASLAAGNRSQGAVAGAISAIAGASIIVSPLISVSLYEIRPELPFVMLVLMSAALFAYCWRSRPLATAGMARIVS